MAPLHGRQFTSLILLGLMSAGNAYAALPATPIKLADASGITPPIVKKMTACPFLSDTAALASVKTEHQRVSTHVSNTRCAWQKNRGFSLVASIEAAGNARPFAERHYNSDKKTKVEPLSAPGHGATMLSHTTWGKPIAYALGFKLGDKAVFIKATGLKVMRPGLIEAANEIAKRLPGAAQIDEQYRETKPAFDNCTVWGKQALLAQLKLPGNTAYSDKAGNTYCSFEIGKKQASGHDVNGSLSFSPLRKRVWEKLLKNGAKPISGYDVPVILKTYADKNGTTWSMMADVRGTMTLIALSDRLGNDRSADVAQLMRNLLSRLK